MKIYFSPDYAPDTYINLKDNGGIEFDCTVVGVEGLVSLVELYLGIHIEPTTTIERQAQWLKHMRKAMANIPSTGQMTEIVESWHKNALGVSNAMLRWRDLLRMTGWKNSMHQPAERFQIVADADKDFNMPSVGDRIIALLDTIDRNPFAAGSTICVGAQSEDALMPLVAELLKRLASQGVEIKYDEDAVTAPEGSNLAKVQTLLCTGASDDTLRADDDTFKVWQFETANDACRYVASIPEDEFDVYILSEGKLLDNTQQMLGQPTSGTTITNSAPQIAQMFLLGMNLFEYPLNINNLLAWLQMPIHPINSTLRHALVRAIISTTGFDNEQYNEAIGQYMESLTDDKEREKAREKLETFDVRPSQMVDMAQLRKFNNALSTWASQVAAMDDTEESKRQQLYVVTTLCNTLATLLDDVTDTSISYRRLEAAISTLYNGADFRIYPEQAGARFTTDCSGIVGSADSILWGDCYNYTPETSPYDFLNAEERAHFKAQGCKFQTDNDFNRAAIHALKLPVLRARKKCVIVTAKRMSGADTTQHPVMIQLTEGFKHTLQNVVEKPSAAEFETRAIRHVDNINMSTSINVCCSLPMPERESYSSIDMLIQFPLDYVLEKIAKIYTMASTNLKRLQTVKGDVAHAVIEALFDGDAHQIESNIKNHYDSTLERIIKEKGALLMLPENELDCKQFRSELRECLLSLLGIIRANGLKVESREKEINAYIGLLSGADDPQMKGFIDMVLSDSDGKKYIFDFKWTGRHARYRDMIKQNLGLQLAIYRQLLENESGEPVAACAYFTMPRHELYTASSLLTGADVVSIVPDNTDDLVQAAINSYRYRRGNLEKGIIDDEEGCLIADLDYTAAAGDPPIFFPLKKMYKKEEYHEINIYSNYSSFKFGILK